MERKIPYLLLFLGLFGLIGLCLLHGGFGISSAESVAGKLSRNLQQEEAWINQFCQTNNWEELIQQADPWTTLQAVPNLETQLRNHHLLIFEQDSLIFWTDDQLTLSPSVWKRLNGRTKPAYFDLASGFYALIPQKTLNNRQAFFSIALIQNYPDLKWLGFRQVPNGFHFSSEKEGQPVKNSDGDSIGTILFEGDYQTSNWGILFLALLLMGCSSLFGSLKEVLKLQLAHLPAMMSFLGTILLFRWLLSFSGLLRTLPGFGPDAPEILGIPLGYGALDSLICLWLMLQFARFFPKKNLVHLPHRHRFWLSSLSYLPLFLGVFLIERFFKILMLEPSLRFDFNIVFTIGGYELLALIITALLLMAFFIFTNRMLEHIVQMDLARYQRLGALFCSLLFAIPLAIVLFPSWDIAAQTLLLALVFTLLLDLFSDSPSRTLTWLFIWLVFFALFASILLYNYQIDRMEKEQYAIAEQLTDIQDPLAQKALGKLAEELDGSPDKIQNQLDSLLYRFPYLYQYYDFEQIEPSEDQLSQSENQTTTSSRFHSFQEDAKAVFPYQIIPPQYDSFILPYFRI